jgi:hypothetical protein
MTGKQINADAHSPMELDQATKLKAIRLWPSLLAAADRLLDANENAAAIIVASTACEVVVARAMIQASGLPAKRPLSYSLFGKKMRRQYKAATADDIKRTSFWKGYERLVEDRNDAVHAGHEVDGDSARQDVDAAKAFVEHVATHNRLT